MKLTELESERLWEAAKEFQKWSDISIDKKKDIAANILRAIVMEISQAHEPKSLWICRLCKMSFNVNPKDLPSAFNVYCSQRAQESIITGASPVHDFVEYIPRPK